MGLAAVAFGPASAQVDPRAMRPAPQLAQAQPAPARPVVLTPASQTVYPTQTYAAPTGFAAYKQYLIGKARREGVREATIQATVPYLQLNYRAIELDRAQQPRPRTSNFMAPFAPYRQRHVTPVLISRGQSRYSQHWPHLYQIQNRYGVDPAVLMAIYGHETSYGSITGSFDLLEALASLAYEGRRRQMFETEFLAALKLLDNGVSRARLRGSYAGATGYPQFMPTAALRLRVDGDGDGYANIWSNEVDGLASIANYLRDAGWKPGVPWGIAAHVPQTINRYAIRSTLNAPRCATVHKRHSRWLSMREWRALGVVPLGRTLAENEMATLLEPDGPGARAYLLTANYRAILDYNCSNYYALSVGLLADAIARR
ncbi:lytic transglycosylase domain-containing protein [Sphingomonas sp.]|uniref:lytic murein transglycosylase n=1 Tax=Sphingomonas sp. TaxID=28214 RepID=UPI0025DF3B34|nr:lytic murein transglycosylase [Sphingomonas sp.]